MGLAANQTQFKKKLKIVKMIFTLKMKNSEKGGGLVKRHGIVWKIIIEGQEKGN